MKIGNNLELGPAAVERNLSAIAKIALASGSSSKSGGGYMGLFKTSDGLLTPVKFLTHHSERGCHYDRTIMKKNVADLTHGETFFKGSETLERTLLLYASKYGAKNEVQRLLADWREKTAYKGKTFLSREVTLNAVRAISKGMYNSAAISQLKGADSVAHTSLQNVADRFFKGSGVKEEEKYLTNVKAALNTTEEEEATAHTKKAIKFLYSKQEITDIRQDGRFAPRPGSNLSIEESKLLKSIYIGTLQPSNKQQVGHGYMGLTLKGGKIEPLKFLTHYSERGAKSDKSIMKSVAEEDQGELAFKSSDLLADVLLKLAEKVSTETKNSVEELFRQWKAKSACGEKTLLSRAIVNKAVMMIVEGDDEVHENDKNRMFFIGDFMNDIKNTPVVPDDTRINQLNALDAEKNLDDFAAIIARKGEDNDDPNVNDDNV